MGIADPVAFYAQQHNIMTLMVLKNAGKVLAVLVRYNILLDIGVFLTTHHTHVMPFLYVEALVLALCPRPPRRFKVKAHHQGTVLHLHPQTLFNIPLGFLWVTGAERGVIRGQQLAVIIQWTLPGRVSSSGLAGLPQDQLLVDTAVICIRSKGKC